MRHMCKIKNWKSWVDGVENFRNLGDESGQNMATPHDLGPQKVAKKGKSPYFRKIQVGEILFHLAR